MSISPTAANVHEMERLTHGYDVGSKDAIVGPFVDLWAKHVVPAGIAETAEEVSHFISQIATETDHFKTLEEYASGAAYEGRADLGNTQPGDGPRFKGRGYIQLTGRANYTAAAERTGLDIVNHPELVSENPETGLICAVDYWIWRVHDLPNVNSDHPEDVKAVTKAVNGGTNGLDSRLAHFRACGIIWPMGRAPDAPAPSEPTDAIPASKLEDARASLTKIMDEAYAAIQAIDK